jgi:hypothetical protein
MYRHHRRRRALAAAGPGTALYAAPGLTALATAAFIVIARREARQRGRA